jgi:hypothetical protein
MSHEGCGKNIRARKVEFGAGDLKETVIHFSRYAQRVSQLRRMAPKRGHSAALEMTGLILRSK